MWEGVFWNPWNSPSLLCPYTEHCWLRSWRPSPTTVCFISTCVRQYCSSDTLIWSILCVNSSNGLCSRSGTTSWSLGCWSQNPNYFFLQRRELFYWHFQYTVLPDTCINMAHYGKNRNSVELSWYAPSCWVLSRCTGKYTWKRAVIDCFLGSLYATGHLYSSASCLPAGTRWTRFCSADQEQTTVACISDTWLTTWAQLFKSWLPLSQG